MLANLTDAARMSALESSGYFLDADVDVLIRYGALIATGPAAGWDPAERSQITRVVSEMSAERFRHAAEDIRSRLAERVGEDRFMRVVARPSAEHCRPGVVQEWLIEAAACVTAVEVPLDAFERWQAVDQRIGRPIEMLHPFIMLNNVLLGTPV